MSLFLNEKPRQAVELTGFLSGGHARNRTGVRGFAVRCVTTPPRGPLAGGGTSVTGRGASGKIRESPMARATGLPTAGAAPGSRAFALPFGGGSVEAACTARRGWLREHEALGREPQ